MSLDLLAEEINFPLPLLKLVKEKKRVERHGLARYRESALSKSFLQIFIRGVMSVLASAGKLRWYRGR